MRKSGSKGTRPVGSCSSMPIFVVAIFVLSRVVMLPFWFRGWKSDESIGNHGSSFLYYLGWLWDGGWYGDIATVGYPSELPRDPITGSVLQNNWEFLPAYPMLGRLIMQASGLPWEVVGVSLSLGLGLTALLLLAKLLPEVAPDLCRRRPKAPYLAVTGLAFFPSAGVFSLAYAESMAIVLILLSLRFIHRRAYMSALIPVILLGFTRPIALPIAAVVVWHAVVRIQESASQMAPKVPVRDLFLMSLLTLASAVSGLVWPAICGMVTGVADGYFLTQSAWRAGQSSSMPFAGWTTPFEPLAVGVVLMILILVFAGTWFFTPSAAELGDELRSWGLAYIVFMLAATSMNTGVFRYALPSLVLPIAMMKWVKTRVAFVTMSIVLLVSQGSWIVLITTIGRLPP